MARASKPRSCSAFAWAIGETGYGGGYTAVYPIKVNQHMNVAGELVAAGSEIAFVTRQMGVPVEGRFKRWSATLAFDPRAPQAADVAAAVSAGDTAWVLVSTAHPAKFREIVEPLAAVAGGPLLRDFLAGLPRSGGTVSLPTEKGTDMQSVPLFPCSGPATGSAAMIRSTQSPARRRSESTRSVRSQENSGSSRPKWP